MKALYIILYAIGSILLIISCFTPAPATMWWLGGISVVCLIAGCVVQYYTSKDNYGSVHHHQP